MSILKLCIAGLGSVGSIGEELKDLKQTVSLNTFIQDFDIMWNRAEISEKQASVFFVGGLEMEIKIKLSKNI